jgi:hypothetical protein
LTSASVAIRKTNPPTGWMKKNHTLRWASMISPARIEPAMTVTSTKHNARLNSYEITCAEERIPPIMAYLLFDDQPASTIP